MSARLLVSARLREIAMRCTDADDVATYLRRRRIRGHRANPRTCPLAVWLHAATGGIDVRVQPAAVWVMDDGVHVSSVPLPQVLRCFEAALDRGEYPQLLAAHAAV